MKTRIALVVLCLVIGVPVLHAQTEESVDSSETTDTGETVTTSTRSTSVTTRSTSTTNGTRTPASKIPAWVHLVRLAAVAGPFAFLFLAWLIGILVHVRLVHREHEQFPALRGTRSPQTVPMIISAMLFFVPAILFVIFEIRSRVELRRGIGGVVDEWHPVTGQAWITLLICLVLALVPWLLARRADTVS